MLKPSSPAATVPGMTDTLDFVKNLWGSMSIPGTNMSGIPGMSAMSGMASPALSADELDKRIADLKAVESWLNMNLTMLRGTIQGMEVQRSTLVTLKTMGASMAEAMRQSGVSADKMAAMPFASFFGQAAATPASSAAAGKPQNAGGGAQPGAGAPQGDASQTGAADKSPGAEAASAASMGMPAAMAWWNLLQEQFTQAVTTAMTPASGAAGSSAAPATAASDLGKATPPPEAQTGGAAPEGGSVNGNGGAAGGNGKGRSGKQKADKA